MRRSADATSHLFFAYLRTLAPEQQNPGAISMLPRSLQALLQDTEYPPKRPLLMQAATYKVVMIVESVSATPFSLLRRGNHFQYREDSLQRFSEYEDPVAALTEECRRVLRAIAAANQTQAVSSAKHSTGLRDASWSRFEDIGFQSTLADDDEDDYLTTSAPQPVMGLRTTPASGANRGGRPTTPSWADFLSSGFIDERAGSPTNLLPPDKVLPPIDTQVRQRSAQSHRPRLESQREVEQGELASINRVDLDEAFWWVWMNSLAPEETPDRKAAFGRCAVIETIIRNGRWLVFEEVVKGAAPEPQEGAYVAQKKSFFSWRRKDKDKTGVARHKSAAGKKTMDYGDNHLKPSSTTGGISKTSLGPDQQAKIQAAAQQLQAKQQRERAMNQTVPVRRGRTDAELMAEKTKSVMTLQPMIMKEASPAMKWANKYDKDTIREAYLANSMAGRGLGQSTMQSGALNGLSEEPSQHSPSIRSTQDDRRLEPPSPMAASERGRESPLPPPPQEEYHDSMDMVRDDMMSPEPAEPESPKQKKKLHKDKEEKKGGGGFRRLFGRNRRASKVPDNTPVDMATFLAGERGGPTPEPSAPKSPVKADTPQQHTPTQQTPPRQQNPVSPMSPEHAEDAESSHEDVSRVNTAEADLANDEFARFDQGPLSDQPAFIPDDEDDEDDDAIPPPIQRHRSATPEPEPEVIEEPPAEPQPKTKPRPRPMVQSNEPQTAPAIERWAQIKKNAAERAATARMQQQDEPKQAPAKASGKPEEPADANGEESM